MNVLVNPRYFVQPGGEEFPNFEEFWVERPAGPEATFGAPDGVAVAVGWDEGFEATAGSEERRPGAG